MRARREVCVPLSPVELGQAGMLGPQLPVRPRECPSQVGKVKAYRRKDGEGRPPVIPKLGLDRGRD